MSNIISFMKIKTYALICSTIFLLACTSSKEIHGNWKTLDSELNLNIDSKQITFNHIPSDGERVINYRKKGDLILFTNEVGKNDTIKIISINSDTLILGLKELGVVKNFKFITNK